MSHHPSHTGDGQEHDFSSVAGAIDRLHQEINAGFEWFKSNSNFATKTDLMKLKEEIMATVTEALAAFNAQMTTYNDATDAAIGGLQGDVANLNAQIATLQASPGAITPADQATLDAIQARAKVITDKLAALDQMTPPVVPAA
jgi:hypothetical protein